MEAIILLILSGLLLLFFEVFIPGGILGTLGAICFLGASLLGYKHYGVFEGLGIFIISIFITIAFFIFEFKYLSKTRLGRAFFLGKKVDEKNTFKGPKEDIVGALCMAQTDLSPTGIVVLDDKQYEAKSQDGFIQKGTQLRVVGHQSFHILVTKLNS